MIRIINLAKEELDIEEIKKRNIISINKTNFAYVESHKLTIDNTTYLFLNDSDYVFINTLENKIRFSTLNDYIELHKN